MRSVYVTCNSGDGAGVAIEQTELIFIIGIWSVSSLHWLWSLSATRGPMFSFFSGVCSPGSGNKKDKGLH